MKKEEFYKLVPSSELKSIIDSSKTPCYIYFRRIIGRQYKNLKDCLPEGFQVNYALKANPNRHVVGFLNTLGCGADAASIGEVKRAEEAGISPELIEFSGPGKGGPELEYAIERRISSINAESIQEIEKILAISRAKNIKANVGIRINPSSVPYGSSMKMGGDTQFGITEEDAERAISFIRENDRHLSLTGFHMHLGSQMLSEESIVKHFAFVLSRVTDISRRLKIKVKKVNFGGGWGIDYFRNQKGLDLTAVKEGLSKTFERRADDVFDKDTKFIVEPGRFLVGESGVYVSRVLYHKKGNKKDFLIIDGGMHQHYVAAGGLGQIIKRNFEIDLLCKEPSQASNVYTVAGRLCTPDDIMASDLECNGAVKEGDCLIFFNSGAYGYTASPLHFLSHEPPLELII